LTHHTDPFCHHPELRDLIKDPATSFFYNFNPADLDEIAAAEGRPPDWRYSDAERDAAMHVARKALAPGDIWVFGYGSLLWDPGFPFVEVRHAYAPDYARQFILWVEGGRGTPTRPGVTAALDKGQGCDGMIFRIAADAVDKVFPILWRRERIAPAYLPQMIAVDTPDQSIEALAFVADHQADAIRPELTREQQIEALATAEGMLGPNLEYIVNLKAGLDALGLKDPQVDELCAAALARHKALSQST